MAADPAAQYLRDFGREVMSLARREVAANDAADGFAARRRLAYYEVVSLMIDQAQVFGISADDIGLAGVDPDRDLVGGGR